MKLFTEIQPLVDFIGEIRLKGKSIGLIPTMGYLHQGHITLLKNSVSENDISICTLFVNPTQFNNPEDLKNYPRDEKRDLSLLETNGCDIVFSPNVEEIYHEDRVVNFNFGYLEDIMEGKFRPNHFKGVGLIVSKFFNIIQPDRAYFGTKDLQQLVLIQKLTKELNYHIDIRPVDTVREEDGLAMSSRNARLTEEEKVQSLILFQCLSMAKEMYLKNIDIDEIRNVILDKCQKSTSFDLEYFEIVNTTSLLPVVNNGDDQHVSACIAGYVGKVRLIDNISII